MKASKNTGRFIVVGSGHSDNEWLRDAITKPTRFGVLDHPTIDINKLKDDMVHRTTYPLNVPGHDDAACNTLLDYEKMARAYESIHGQPPYFNPPLPYYLRMTRIAAQNGVSVERMKQHWRCIECILGPDPLDPLNSTRDEVSRT